MLSASLSALASARKVVGVKQSKKVIREDGVTHEKEIVCVHIACDAEPRVTRPVLELCKERGVEVVEGASMKELGQAAGIDVGATVVVQLKTAQENAD